MPRTTRRDGSDCAFCNCVENRSAQCACLAVSPPLYAIMLNRIVVTQISSGQARSSRSVLSIITATSSGSNEVAGQRSVSRLMDGRLTLLSWEPHDEE